MNLYLLTIPRTGSRFLERVIKPDLFNHVSNPEVPERLNEARVAVTSLRHPAEVWKAWAVRGGSMHDFWANWRLLDTYSYKYQIYAIPVDLPAVRDEALADLSRATGIQYETDWEPYGAFDGPGDKSAVVVPDMSLILRYPIVNRFYPG